MSRFLVAAAAAALALAGCARNYASSLPATGEPLAYDWMSFRQGKDPIDEQDFYRIGGDAEGASQIEKTRSRGIFYNRAGWVLAGIGLGGLLLATTTDSAGLHKTGYGLMLALPIGGTMAFYGQHKAKKRPQLSGRRARETADRYNAHLPGASVGSAP
jgi:hypothetical protein